MADYKLLLESLLAATHRGLDIITDCCPAAAEVANTPKKKFRLRPDERTPSAQLIPPRDGSDCWHVKDYGGGEGESYFSPVDLYMWSCGLGQHQFMPTLQLLAERYGVQDELKQGANRPAIEQHTVTEEELLRGDCVDPMEGFGGIDLKAIWGPNVTADHLKALGWCAIRSRTIVRDGKATIVTATDSYPMFAEKCTYYDSEGHELCFWKCYEPYCYDKAFRFSIIGKKPYDYIFGLEALKQAFHRHEDKKLPVVLLVSGGSDAVNALSMGYQPIWLDSETRPLTQQQLTQLQEYGWRVVNIPDVDTTGRRMGISLALNLPTLYTAWMTPADFYGTHDNRGRLCKDLKDFLRINRTKKDMERLIGRARRAKFWDKRFDKDGNFLGYTIHSHSLNYFLSLYGYFTIKDDTQKEPQYVHVKNHVVRRVVSKTVRNFLKEWCEHEGLEEELIDKLMTAKNALPTDNVSYMVERDDLDFSSCTATSQTFCFRNGLVKVTADKISWQSANTDTGHYVWEESIIGHDFRDMKPMFDVAKGDDQRYHITINPGARSNLLRFLVNSSRLYWRKADELGLELTEEERAEEEQCLIAKMLNLGYMLHRYKSSSEARATLCLDAAMTEGDDDANGRSGKSFYINTITQLVRAAEIDGRTMSQKTNMQFIFADVNETTAVIKVDECSRDFNFEYFFGQISNNITVEKKGRNPFTIPFSQAPKFIFGSNYVLKKHDPSRDARLWPVLFSDYYHQRSKNNDYREDRSIRSDFGRDLMREDYSEQDWQADIHLMLECVQLYLSLPVGERQMMPPLGRIERREQRAALGKNFRQWAEENLGEDSEYLDREVKIDELFNLFKQETGSMWAKNLFSKTLKEWCNYASHIACYNPASVTGLKEDGARWQKRMEGTDKRFSFCYLQTVSKAAETTQPEEQALPF